MRLPTLIFAVAVLVLSLPPTVSPAQWATTVATIDDAPNGPGNQVPSVAVIGENSFVVLVTRIFGYTPGVDQYDDVNARDTCSMNYLVAYSNATDGTGRMTVEPYGSANTGRYAKWASGFDEVPFFRAYKAVGMPDSLVYIANNDPDHNILVFRQTIDSVESTEWRLITGSDEIMGLGVDSAGYVYVATVYSTVVHPGSIRVFKGPRLAPEKWVSPYTDTPVQSVPLPEGVYRGLAVSGDGQQIFVSSMSSRNVTRFVGGPTTGYSVSATFHFQMSDADTIIGTQHDSAGTAKWDFGRPLGMGYMNGNNLLFVAAARWLGLNIKTHTATSAYEYSKIFILNPVTGEGIDTIDVAYWDWLNSDTTGAARSYMTPNYDRHTSGYASTYDVGFDEKHNLYSQSMFGWTAEKWVYNGTLPVIPLSGVRQVSSAIPSGFSLAQNFPNPFNPTTTIRFSLQKSVHVRIVVYNLLGQFMTTLVDEAVGAGTHEVLFDATRLASGVYYYSLQAGPYNEIKRMTLLK